MSMIASQHDLFLWPVRQLTSEGDESMGALPTFVDFEASSLRSASYPIEEVEYLVRLYKLVVESRRE